jgi:AP-3 complex subunit delta-1
MSQTKFAGKRIGYTAASQSFHEATEVTMLATNLLKKDFNSGNPYEAGLAISCLSNIVTPDLARDLAPDVVTMLSSSRPYVKKRATLVLYKVFLKYPDSLRPSFPRLKTRLTDDDPGVVSAAVNVVCELAKRNPKNYLSLAPILFKILTESQNNWMLIKIVKLLAALTPVEPRLARKLVDPLTSLMNATPAMSLLYECIQLCTVGLSQHVPIMRLCLAKLRMFVEDQDQNLKYLGLVALGDIMQIHPKAVAEHRDLILSCLDDEDITIRHRALSLLNGLVSKKNLADIVRKLLDHAHSADVTARRRRRRRRNDDDADRDEPAEIAAAGAADGADGAAATPGATTAAAAAPSTAQLEPQLRRRPRAQDCRALLAHQLLVPVRL